MSLCFSYSLHVLIGLWVQMWVRSWLALGLPRLCLLHLLIQLTALIFHVATSRLSLALHVSTSLLSFGLNSFSQSSVLVMSIGRVSRVLSVRGCAASGTFDFFSSHVCLLGNFIFFGLLFGVLLSVGHFLRETWLVRFLFDFGCTPVKVAYTRSECSWCFSFQSFHVILLSKLLVWVRWIVFLLLLEPCLIILDLEFRLMLLTAFFVQWCWISKCFTLSHWQ